MTTQQQEHEQRIRRLETAIARIDATLLTISSKEDVERSRGEARADNEALRADQERLRAELLTSLEALRADLTTELERIRGEAKADNESLRTEIERLRAEMYRMESRLIRWVVASAVASVAAIAAFISIGQFF